MTPLLHSLHTRLEPWREAPAWRVAFSGGLDSTVLLHLLVDLGRHMALPPLSALHIHHGLQPAADAWPAHCQRVCDSLGIPLRVVSVQVAPGASLEQAARNARYAAFERCLEAGEVLLSAQHRDDQAETLLFRLLRGAGVRGLAAMAEQRGLGAGVLVRPLLGVARAELHAWALARGLSWIEDPSNTDNGFSRNYLRHEVFPSLTARWPQAATSMARSAAHLGEALGLLEELAMQDLATARVPADFPWLDLPSLQLSPLAALSPARQRNALQYWLTPLTRLPDAQHWRGWEDVRDARDEALPVWRLSDGELRRAAGRLWWLGADWRHAPPPPLSWDRPDEPLELPGNGQVRLLGGRPAGSVEIRYRHGGETLYVPGRGHRDLKRLLNESGLPSFVRARLPLLFIDGRLSTVANLPGLASGAERLSWRPPTSDQGLR